MVPKVFIFMVLYASLPSAPNGMEGKGSKGGAKGVRRLRIVRPPTAAAGGPKAAAGRRPNATAEQASAPTQGSLLIGCGQEERGCEVRCESIIHGRVVCPECLHRCPPPGPRWGRGRCLRRRVPPPPRGCGGCSGRWRPGTSAGGPRRFNSPPPRRILFPPPLFHPQH